MARESAKPSPNRLAEATLMFGNSVISYTLRRILTTRFGFGSAYWCHLAKEGRLLVKINVKTSLSKLRSGG
jgi:hypothetical protein